MVSALAGSGVVINEVAPATGSVNKWVELYNASDDAVDIGGWRLMRGTQKFGNNIPGGTSLGAHEFYVVESTVSLPLNANGKPLKLMTGPASTGVEADSVDYGVLLAGKSYARVADGDDTFVVRAAADVTKGTSNSGAFPAVPTNLRRVAKDDGEVLPCSPVPVVTPQTVWPTWDANAEPDFNHYEYTSYNADGKVGINEKKFTTAQYKHNWVPTEDGKSGFKVRAVDDAGNKSAWSDICYITYDSQPPTVTLSSPAGNPTVGGNTLTLRGSIVDPNGISEYRFQRLDENKKNTIGNSVIGGHTAINNGVIGELSIGDLPSGTYFVRVWATDAAGNKSTPVYAQFTIDHTPPAVTGHSTGTPHPMASTDAITLAGQVTGDFKTLELTQDDGELSMTMPLSYDKNGNWTYELPKDRVVAGTYTFTVVAADAYGNESAPAVLSVTARPYLPSEEKSMRATASLKSPSAPRFIAPRTFAAGTTAPFTATEPKEKPDDTAVLGTETAKEPAQPDELPVVAATESGWKVFGVAWYWWALIAAIVAAGAWATVASVRRRKVAEVV